MGLDQIPHNFMTARLEDVVRWGRRNSVFPATFGLACCALEMMATGAAHYDLARFGMEVFRASPRQADLMIVAGRVSQKMAPVLRQVYDQMVEPKWVISMGVCASSGGMFNNYAIVQGVDQIVPVDVYVPGCPPGPETLMHGILTLHEQIRTGELLGPARRVAHGRRRHPAARARRDCSGGNLRRQEETTMAADDAPAREDVHEGEPEPVVPDDPIAPDDEVAAAIVARFEGAVFARSHGQPVVYVDRSVFAEVAGFLRDEQQFTMCVDITATDHLLDGERYAPAGVATERFEVVANYLSHVRNRRVRVICAVPGLRREGAVAHRRLPGHRTSPSARPTTFYGIDFVGHPELTRILMPDDWEGHPLRKDYPSARVPVTFKGDPHPR